MYTVKFSASRFHMFRLCNFSICILHIDFICFYIFLHLYVLHIFCPNICITSFICSLKVNIIVSNTFSQAYPRNTPEIICIACKYLRFFKSQTLTKEFYCDVFHQVIKKRTPKGIPWISVACTPCKSEYLLLCSNFASFLKVLLALWIMDLEIVILRCCSSNITYFHWNKNLRQEFQFYFVKQSLVNTDLFEMR